MTHLRDLPIKWRLIVTIVTTCTGVLIVACGALATYEFFQFRNAMARDTTVLAAVIGANTQAAITFEDKDAARATLETLAAEPHVIAAALYDGNGEFFVKHVRPGVAPVLPLQPGADGYEFSNGRLGVFHPVELRNKRIGTIYLQSDLDALYARLRIFGSVSLLILLGAIVIAVPFSAHLQQPISRPIQSLAQTARAVAERQDYSIRATKETDNEIGTLTDAFNGVLDGIERHEVALASANEALRAEVIERQQAEAGLHAQLSRLHLLRQITSAIGERQDVPSILQVVIDTLEDQLPVEFACILHYDATSHVLSVGCVGLRSDKLASAIGLTLDAPIAVDDNGLANCVRGNLVYEPNIQDVAFPFPQRLAGGQLHSLVLSPLQVESTIFGVLAVARSKPNSFNSAECEFIRQLSSHVALASHQAQLYSALHDAYEELRQTQQAILQQERLRALGQMASGIAHDINNALSPVALYTESLLEQEPNLSNRARDYLATIQRAVEDVAQTVSRMREFYRQREQQMELAPMYLNQIVDQVVDLTRARWLNMAQQRGIVIEMKKELDLDFPTVMGVESEIREALTNLVFNAVDAMPQGGTITMRTRRVAAEGSPQAGDTTQVAVEVCDTGFGMDEETRRRCLEPFFTTKGERGTGLGLAMVYGSIQRHNADIQIESTLGEGTLIRLLFQASRNLQPEETARGAHEAAPRMRLLVVDDDPLLIRSLRDTLEADGHEVVVAHGGQDGIDAFGKALEGGNKFELVITDLGMPYVDGRKVAERIKGMSPQTPVIMLTGWGQRLVATGDIPAHVDQVLAKPPKLHELRAVLARFAAARQSSVVA